MTELGIRLRQFRLAQGWSKRAVARELDVSVPSISRWENGFTDPNDYNRHKIKSLLAQNAPSLFPPPRRHKIYQLNLFSQRMEKIS